MDHQKYTTTIYAIVDVKANQMVGGLMTHKHEAAAVRMFSDIANAKDTMIQRHPQDFNLVRLGYITHDYALAPDYADILTGQNWKAAQDQQQPAELDMEYHRPMGAR